MRQKFLILIMLFIFIPLFSYSAASDISSLTKEQQNVKDDIDDVNEKIMDYEEDITTTQESIDENDEKIEDLKSEKEENEKVLEESRSGFDETLVMLQKINNTNTIVTYFYDENTLDNNYFLKLENINTIFDSIAGDLKVYVDNIEAVQTDIDEIKTLQDENEEALSDLDEKKTEQEEIETTLKEQLADIEADIGAVALTTSGAASSSEKEAIMSAAGISSSDYTYVDYIITKESGWNATADNPMSSAYGLCQALPGSKMASAGSDWATNPVTQMKWCDSYATSRYGSWSSAYNFWISNNWW